jgi:hypothetical protein
MQASVQFRPYFFPRNCLDFARIDLANPALDLRSPRRLYSFVRLTIQALEESTCKFRSIGLR